jgi:S-adenosylmethionine hydrolase
MVARQITFLSDFGTRDVFVGLCHAVMAAITPGAPVADLTHDIAPHDVRAGAVALADCVPYVPAAVHLAVVDPGVGSQRAGVVLVAGDALLVGPDNGLLLHAARRLGGVGAAYRLSEPRLRAPRVSRTFHGRDIFAPAAAHLAGGTAPAAFGPALDVAGLVEIDLPAAEIGDGIITAPVRSTDRFGNAQLAITAADLERAGLSGGQRLQLLTGHKTFEIRHVGTFADLAGGELGLIEDSFGWLAVVLDRAAAARQLRLEAFDMVRLQAR